MCDVVVCSECNTHSSAMKRNFSIGLSHHSNRKYRNGSVRTAAWSIPRTMKRGMTTLRKDIVFFFCKAVTTFA